MKAEIRNTSIARHMALAVLPLLAACVPLEHGAQMTLPSPTGDALSDAAALLAAAEAAPDASSRAAIIERLDALNVRPAADEAEDPLGRWRSEHVTQGTTPWRGRALGPAYRRARVEPGQKLRIEQVFLAGQRAEIAAQTSGGGQVALAVAGPRSEAICERNLAPSGRCNWLPIFTERFSIELENRGNRTASVYIVFR